MESRTPPRIEEPRVVSFTGVYQHQIDAKGRTSLPSRFREVLAAQGADKLFVTTDLFDSCLQAYAPAQWTAFTQKVAALSQFDPSVRLLVRSFVAPAQECPVDKVGRILIPPPLREHAGLADEVTWAARWSASRSGRPRAGWRRRRRRAHPRPRRSLQRASTSFSRRRR